MIAGGRGSGKSTGGAMRTLHYALTWDGALGIVTAPTIQMLHDATIPSLLRVMQDAGLEPGPDYEYFALPRDELIFRTGSRETRIIFRPTEHPDRLRGQDAAFAWMDEPAYAAEKAFLNLQATLRQQGYPHQMWMTGTPRGRLHWTYQLFQEQAGSTGRGTYRLYRAPTLDNPHGGLEHYEQMVQTYGADSAYTRQELKGEYVITEKLVYPMWDAAYHVVPIMDWPSFPDRRIAAGVDFGFTNPCAVVVGGIDEEGRHYLIEEFYGTGMSHRELILVCRDFQQRYGVRWFFADSADPGWISALRHNGVHVAKANKRMGIARDPSSGIGLVASYLTPPDDRSREAQRFFVSPGMTQFREEIEQYIFEDPQAEHDPRERPRKFSDHGLDALRYLYNGYSRLGWLSDYAHNLSLVKTSLRAGRN